MAKAAVKNKTPWQFPESARDGLARDLVTASRDLAVAMRGRVNLMKFDATETEIKGTQSALMALAKKLFAPVISSLTALASTIYRFNRRQFLKVDKKAGGVAYVTMEKMPERSEKWYKHESKQWIALTTQSIEKLYTDQVNDFTSKIRLANLRSSDSEQVQVITKERYEIYRSWAINRSEGIVGSWNSRLMRLNLESVGVSSYTWHGWLDDRERESHVLLEGKSIELNAVHIFPGEEYGCRCWASPDYGKENK